MARKWILKGYKVRPVLKIGGVPHSTYYYQLKHTHPKQAPKGGRPVPGHSCTFEGEKVPDTRIKRLIMKLLEGEESAYGYRKITVALRRKHRKCFRRHIFMDFEEAFTTLDRFMDFYNNRRFHMSLYGYSPVEFAENNDSTAAGERQSVQPASV